MVRDAREGGHPLSYLVECLYSRRESELSARLLRLMRSSDPDALARALRRAEAAAYTADHVPVPYHPTSRAVGDAIRSYEAHSQEHRKRYGSYEGPAATTVFFGAVDGGEDPEPPGGRRDELYLVGGDPRSSAPPEFWESVADLLDRRIDLERAMAKASGRAISTASLERKAVAYRARAERLRDIADPESWAALEAHA